MKWGRAKHIGVSPATKSHTRSCTETGYPYPRPSHLNPLIQNSLFAGQGGRRASLWSGRAPPAGTAVYNTLDDAVVRGCGHLRLLNISFRRRWQGGTHPESG